MVKSKGICRRKMQKRNSGLGIYNLARKFSSINIPSYIIILVDEKNRDPDFMAYDNPHIATWIV